MKAFHGDIKVKKKYVTRVMAHQKADNLIQGTGWTNGKGCAVGCTLENYDHSRYPIELGIPEWLARVEDTLFEGMSKKKASTWPEKFLKAINVGSDLEKAKVKFITLILQDSLKSISRAKYDKTTFPQVEGAIKQVRLSVKSMIKAQKSGNTAGIQAASSAASSAANAAYSAARSAANSAANAASSAAEAANAASSAAEAANAAYSAAYSAARSAAYSAANSAANAAYHGRYADGLLKILKGIKK